MLFVLALGILTIILFQYLGFKYMGCINHELQQNRSGKIIFSQGPIKYENNTK